MQEDVIVALRGGRTALALTMAQTEVQSTPRDAQAHRLLAIAQAMNGDHAAAHASLDRAVALAPNDASLHYQRATLLLNEQRRDEARTALERSVGLDPNAFRAYLLQAQLALWGRDLEEAERQLQLASKLDARHPELLTLRGLTLLHRQRPQEAHELLMQAAHQAPDNVQTQYALGMSFIAQGHYAFAEQAFTRVLDKVPRSHAVRHMLADAVRQQGRLPEAAGIIEAGLALDPDLPPDLLRYAGEIRLVSKQIDRALPLLKRAAAQAPTDRRTLDALIEGLRRQGDFDDARRTLDAALAAAPQIEGLWSARLSFEPRDGDIAGIAGRWQEAIPNSVHALHLKMWLAERDGNRDAVKQYAERIVAQDRGHFDAQVQIIEYLFTTDPSAAVAHIESLLPDIPDDRTLRMVLGWLGRAQDRAGRYGDAAETWRRIDAIQDPLAVPLPPRSGDVTAYSRVRPTAPGEGPVFVFGPPGSGVERVVGTLHQSLPLRLRMDRMNQVPPADLLQASDTALRLASGELDADTVATSWRAALPAREADEATVIDWLQSWDHALLRVLHDAIPGASLLLVLADPRDMLIDWLQRGTYVRYRIDSHEQIARWLAGVLEQLATILEDNPVAHHVLRIDAIADNAVALAAQAGDAVGATLTPLQAFGPGRFPAGHWRHYTEALAEPFALLAPVAARLGYPEG